jgi:hypothetical protein
MVTRLQSRNFGKKITGFPHRLDRAKAASRTSRELVSLALFCGPVPKQRCFSRVLGEKARKRAAPLNDDLVDGGSQLNLERPVGVY